MTKAIIGELAEHDHHVRTPPRFALRTFWIAQRAIYRLSHGRMGLASPEAGRQFGMLSLATVGRRSGKARVAIVGYYEDGPNLVTVAMNGWGKAEPAWWLNLQANPEATVELVDGPRAVRARVASGDERERLWAKIVEYPGWGVDIDGLAARRPRPTAVVVLEPRGAAAEADAHRAHLPAPGAVASRALAAGSASSEHASGRGRHLRPRHLWLVPGLALALFASTQASQLAVGLVPLLLFGIVPDVPRFVWRRRPAMVMLYSALHQPALALGLLIATAVTGAAPFAYVGALAWLGHIVVGWAAGDRPRTAGARLTAASAAPTTGHLVLAPEAARATQG